MREKEGQIRGEDLASCVSDVSFHCMGMIRRNVYRSKKQKKCLGSFGDKNVKMTSNDVFNIY